MKLLDWFRTTMKPSPSADTAKERLQLILAIERSGSSGPGFLPQLQQDILEAIKKYIEIDSDKVSIEIERGQTVSTLEVNVELPAAVAEAKSLRARTAVASTGPA